MSNAYLLKGLGYKGLEDTSQAMSNLRDALERKAGNLYASVELNDM